MTVLHVNILLALIVLAGCVYITVQAYRVANHRRAEWVHAMRLSVSKLRTYEHAYYGGRPVISSKFIRAVTENEAEAQLVAKRLGVRLVRKN